MQLDIHLLQSGLHMLSLLVGALGLTAPKRCCNKSNVPSPNCTRVAGWRCFQGASLLISTRAKTRLEAPGLICLAAARRSTRQPPANIGSAAKMSKAPEGLGEALTCKLVIFVSRFQR